jgi:hypothetical protein
MIGTSTGGNKALLFSAREGSGASFDNEEEEELDGATEDEEDGTL